MNNFFKGKMKQVLVIVLGLMFVAVAFSSVTGKPLYKINSEKESNNNSPTRPFRPLFLPAWFYAIVNDDWNYWSSSPDMYAIPTGNVGIGTSSPTEKLQVAGIIHSTSGGFKFPDDTIQTSAATGGGEGNTLDEAYDQGGAGAGRTITADAGAVNIDGPNGLTVNGNVGIGTTNPETAVHVFGDDKVVLLQTEEAIIGNTLKDSPTLQLCASYLNFIGIPEDYTMNITHIMESGGADPHSRLGIMNNDGAELVSIKDEGNIGIGTTTPVSRFHVADGSVLFSGAQGGVPVSGPGTRLMWIPSKSALRAGNVAGDEWDDSNIGLYSMALGYGTKATNTGSVALGDSTVATGMFGATAMGFGTMASGRSSIAMGGNTIASKLYAIAMGFGTTANGDYSTAIGRNIAVHGENSVGIGLDSSSPVVNDDNVMAIMGGDVGIGTTSPHSTLQVEGSLSLPYQLVDASTNSYTVTDSDCVIVVETGQPVDVTTIYLPTAVGITGRVYTIKYLSEENWNEGVLIEPFGSETIDGYTNLLLDYTRELVTIISDGANWIIISQSI